MAIFKEEDKMKLGGWYKVFEGDYDGFACNYLHVKLSLPTAAAYEDHGYGDTTMVYKLCADTGASFVKSKCHWYVGLQVFGFGLSVKRQWDY